MGGLFGGGGSSSTQAANTGPWEGQTMPAADVLDSAQNTLNLQMGQYGSYPFSGSQLYAGITPGQQAGAANLGSIGQSMYGLGNNEMGAGSSLLSGLPTASNTANNFATGNFNQGQTAAGNAAAGTIAGNSAISQAGMAGAMSQIAGNTPQSLSQAAGAMMDSPTIQGEINAAGTDINRQLTQQTLPQLNTTAMAGGNMNSTRAGLAQGEDETNANEQLLNDASTIRSNAYNQGVNLANGQNATNISGDLGAATSANNLINTGIYGETSSNNQVASNNANQLAGANLQSSLGNLGSGMMTAGGALGTSGANAQIAGGNVFQQNQQGQDNAATTAFSDAQQNPWNMINNASNIIQRQQWGQAGTDTGAATQTDNSLSDALAGTSAGAALAKALGGSSSAINNTGQLTSAATSGTDDAIEGMGNTGSDISSGSSGIMSWLSSLF